ncbi:MAG TPA: NAD-dependent epimerase/dehydratase family protein, partial [Gaiellaceae bacterium]|nr:NAD-dependent epimerase/dehydratase family protein [Gaiellaceae bacterium]
TIVLTVGSDCAIGKMTVSLELDRAARARGLASQFVPTGQTGIAIAGWGISIDAVVSDFLAGAAEQLVVEGYERGGTDLLMVEGQGAVTHPAYSGVTLGLIHGSAPHLYVLCHQAGATEVEGYPGHRLLSLPELVELHERLSLPARPARVACIALNTRDLPEEEARAAIELAEAETGLPADDPVRFGAERLLDAVIAGR